MTVTGRRASLLAPILTALGVTFVVAGLLSYTSPVEAGPPASEAPEVIGGDVGPVGSSAPGASLLPGPSNDPFTEGGQATFPPGRVVTRIVVAALHIDLPVIKPPGGPGTFPLCDVAMYIQELGQPGQNRAVYIYAHARVGMFLPLLQASKVNDGRKMLGMEVDAYTSDDFEFKYRIYQVRRHQLDLDDAVAATTEQLWLQTSEGPIGTTRKLQVVAAPVSFSPVDYATAHPTPHPLVCS